MSLNIGDQAPDFTLPSDKNENVSLHDLRGKKVILYFYPKDNTPGCTKQACDFRDALPEFITKDVIVFSLPVNRRLLLLVRRGRRVPSSRSR